eukprot:5886898-Amphidinium_carterae.1
MRKPYCLIDLLCFLCATCVRYFSGPCPDGARICIRCRPSSIRCARAVNGRPHVSDYDLWLSPESPNQKVKAPKA